VPTIGAFTNLPAGAAALASGAGAAATGAAASGAAAAATGRLSTTVCAAAFLPFTVMVLSPF